MNIRTLVTLSVLCAASLTLGYAQQSETVRVHIPFAFVAGGKELPAGDYTLLQSSLGTLTIGHLGSSIVVLSSGNEDKRDLANPGAKFSVLGGRNYLDRVELNDGTVLKISSALK